MHSTSKGREELLFVSTLSESPQADRCNTFSPWVWLNFQQALQVQAYSLQKEEASQEAEILLS